MSQSAAASVFGLSRQSVNAWACRHRQHRAPGLRSRPRGRPPGGCLRPWQAATVVRLITDRCPDQLKMPFSPWTREAVRSRFAGSSACGCRSGRWGGIWRAGASPRRSPSGGATSRTPRPSGGGWRWSIRPFGSSPPGKGPRSTGSTRRGCPRTNRRAPSTGTGGGSGRAPSCGWWDTCGASFGARNASRRESDNNSMSPIFATRPRETC